MDVARGDGQCPDTRAVDPFLLCPQIRVEKIPGLSLFPADVSGEKLSDVMPNAGVRLDAKPLISHDDRLRDMVGLEAARRIQGPQGLEAMDHTQATIHAGRGVL